MILYYQCCISAKGGHMKKIVSIILCLLLVLPCLCISAAGVDFVTEEEADDPTATLRGCSLFYHDPRFMGGPVGWVAFPSGNPEAAAFISDFYESYAGYKAGEFYDGYIYCYRYDEADNYAFCKVDAFTFEETVLNSSTALADDMAYDYSTNTMYAVFNEALYTVSLADGSLSVVGNVGPDYVLALACSTDGLLYAIGDDLNFYTVDKETGMGTIVGATGVEAADNLQSMAYDHNTGKLYWSSCTTVPHLLTYYTTDSALYQLDVNTGAAERIGRSIYDSKMQVTCLHIIPDFYEVEEVPAAELTLSLDNAYLLVGQTAQLNAYTLPANAPKGVTWTIDDESIATIGNGGLVSAVAAGTTTATAVTLDGRLAKSCTIHVITEEELAEFSLADAMDDGGFGGTVTNSTTYPYSVDIRDGRISAKTNMHDSNSYALLAYDFGYLEEGTVVKFDWKTDTRYFSHGLILYVNVPYTANLTGSTGWLTYEYVIPESGSYVFTWSFWRDTAEADGEDCCFVDNILVIEPDSTLPGDANLDGEVTNADAVLIMRHSMGVVELTGQALINADCSGDGIVNTGDALKALRMAVGIG